MAKIRENPTDSNHSFFEDSFVIPLKLTEENNRISVLNPEIEPPASKQVEIPIFEEDKEGNVRINYCDLDGRLYVGYTDAKNPKPVIWHQKRLKEPRGDNKYWSPKGMPVRPFVVALLRLWEKEKPIKTLFLTEGAKKAWVSTMNGAPTVGLTSITTYRDKETGGLHHDIVRIIEENQVECLVFVVDADARNISEKELSAGEDITNRPGRFYGAAKQIRAKAQEIPGGDKLKLYFYQVDAEQLDNPKGLDDLMTAADARGCLPEVMEEMFKPSGRNNRYFQKFDITSSTAKLQEFFGLGRNDVEQFYRLHSKLIQDRKFVFHGDFYQWDEEEGEVKQIAPGWTKNVFFIDNDYYELVNEPKNRKNEAGENETHFIPVLRYRKKGTLQLTTRDKKFVEKIPAENIFQGFCSTPAHKNYERRIGSFYNLYFPLPHEPAAGKFDTIQKFIKHIFGDQDVQRDGAAYKMWELGLDYLTILLRYPLQMLPVLILYSPENNTGKSTFAKLLFRIFGNNAFPASNTDFRNDHNEHFAGKLLAICEETLIDKLEDVERLKSWSTADQITINPKGRTQYVIDFFTKFQLYSNRKKMVYVTEQDDRFWMLQVPVPDERDPELLAKMEAEVPAFLDYLFNRPIMAPKEGRMWFHPDLYKTDLFRETVAVNEPADIRHLRAQLSEMFDELEMAPIPDKGGALPCSADKIYMTPTAINKVFFNGRITNARNLSDQIKEYLKIDRYTDEDGQYKVVETYYPAWYEDHDKEANAFYRRIRWERFNGRPFVFERANFKN
ncbi:MAG: hypothetical protein H6566_29940 [Lewinellaceae bacterium]|nr:hypothetical protein [Lewinellaceae bacterium]